MQRMKLMSSGLAVCGIGALMLAASPQVAEACGGNAPALTCAKTLVLGKGIRRTFVAGGPQRVPVPHGVFLNLSPAAGSPGSSCPTGPASASLTLTATCNVPGTGATTTVPLVLTPNAWNVGFTNLAFPAGPPRICRIVGAVTSTCRTTTGVAITATARGDAQVCFVEPSPTDPSVPRLDLRHIDIDNELVPLDDVIGRSHPGDPISRWYRITNHDGDHTVVVDVTVDSNNTAVWPDPGFPQQPATDEGSGIYSISDPGPGDDFPVMFRYDTPCNDCVPLPPDPMSSIDPRIGQQITLAPGESTVVSIASRSWGMCADGSCGESTILVEGAYDDGSDVTACATASHAVDDTIPPAYEWPESGKTAQYTASPNGLTVALQPSPGDRIALEAFLEVDFMVDGQPLPVSHLSRGELINDDWGRLHTEIDAIGVPFVGQRWSYTGFVSFVPTVTTPGLADVVDMMSIPGAPLGFENTSPMGMGFLDLVTPTGAQSRVELFAQFSIWAELQSGRHVQLEVGNYQLLPAGPGYVIMAQGPLDPTLGPVATFHLLDDQRAFARTSTPPVCEEDVLLVVDDLEPGELTHFYVEGADPGQRVTILRSSAGPGAGPCLPGGSPCAGILAPSMTFTANADARGILELNVRVPAGLPAQRMWWQAAAMSGPATRVSNVVDSPVLP